MRVSARGARLHLRGGRGAATLLALRGLLAALCGAAAEAPGGGGGLDAAVQTSDGGATEQRIRLAGGVSRGVRPRGGAAATVGDGATHRVQTVGRAPGAAAQHRGLDVHGRVHHWPDVSAHRRRTARILAHRRVAQRVLPAARVPARPAEEGQDLDHQVPEADAGQEGRPQRGSAGAVRRGRAHPRQPRGVCGAAQPRHQEVLSVPPALPLGDGGLRRVRRVVPLPVHRHVEEPGDAAARLASLAMVLCLFGRRTSWTSSCVCAALCGAAS